MKFRTGVTKDGRLAGMHLQTLVDGGGYGGYGVASTFYTGALQTVTYELPRYNSRPRASSPTSRRAARSAATARRSRASARKCSSMPRSSAWIRPSCA